MDTFIGNCDKYIGPTLLKIYNKEGKLKLYVNKTEHVKIIYIYRYEQEVTHIHAYTIQLPELSRDRFIKDKSGKYVKGRLRLGGDKLNDKYATFFDYTKLIDSVPQETVRLSESRMEQWEVVGDMEEIKNEHIFLSGNKYETRKKVIEGDELTIYKAVFENGEMKNFLFSVPENKIEEYLDKLKQEE